MRHVAFLHFMPHIVVSPSASVHSAGLRFCVYWQFICPLICTVAVLRAMSTTNGESYVPLPDAVNTALTSSIGDLFSW